MTRTASLQQFLDAACPTIGSLGSAFYFTPATMAKGTEHGLDRGQFYFLGRGGVLGDVDSSVITAAFGYFNPAVVAMMWNSAKAKLAPRAAGTLHLQCCADFGRAQLAGVGGLDGFVVAAEKVVAAAEVDGLSLFAGIAAEPRVDDAPGRAMQLVAVLREFRGSCHLIAVRAAGLSARNAHFITRPDDGRMFGWTDPVEPSADDRARMAQAHATTDMLVGQAYAVLDDAERATFLDVLGAIEAAVVG